jgi:hypothetical protein
MTKWILAWVLPFLVSTSVMAQDDETERTKSIRIAPAALILGTIHLDAEFRVAPTWSVGPALSYWKLTGDYFGFSGGVTTTALGIGARATWQPAGILATGAYVSPTVMYISASSTARSGNRDISASSGMGLIAAVAGYRWYWDAFNMSLGGGAQAFLGDGKVKLQDSGYTAEVSVSKTGALALLLDFMVGFSF